MYRYTSGVPTYLCTHACRASRATQSGSHVQTKGNAMNTVTLFISLFMYINVVLRFLFMRVDYVISLFMNTYYIYISLFMYTYYIYISFFVYTYYIYISLFMYINVVLRFLFMRVDYVVYQSGIMTT